MAENFELEIDYRGNKRTLPAEYLPMGYIFKIKVTIDGIDVFFERDDEGKYRAITSVEDMDKSKTINKELLSEIANTLQQAL